MHYIVAAQMPVCNTVKGHMLHATLLQLHVLRHNIMLSWWRASRRSRCYAAVSCWLSCLCTVIHGGKACSALGINTFQLDFLLSCLTLGVVVGFDVQEGPATIKTEPCWCYRVTLLQYLLCFQQVHWVKDSKKPLHEFYWPLLYLSYLENMLQLYTDASEHQSITLGIRWCPQLLNSIPVSESCTTAAVRPTPEEPLPLALTDTSATCMAALSNCDLAVPGSPTSKQWMSPLRCIPEVKFCSLPPSKRRMIPFLMVSCPRMDGARELASTLRGSGPWAICPAFLHAHADSVWVGESLRSRENNEQIFQTWTCTAAEVMMEFVT